MFTDVLDRFEHAQKLSEIDEFKRQYEEQAKINESQESNWKAMVEKITGENQEILSQLQDTERRYVEDKEHYMVQLGDLNSRLEMELAEKDNLKIRFPRILLKVF